LIKLSEYVHPLVLGQVYRSREQIKMLAEKLIRNQVADDAKIAKIIEFLCSDSGSHDYTINRREAKEELALNVKNPTWEQYKTIKSIYDDFCVELGFGQIFDPLRIQGAYAVRRGFIESIKGGSDYFVTDGRVELVAIDNGQAMQNVKLFEGWRHEGSATDRQVVDVSTQEGDVRYEKDDLFCL
jgi:hypothetical protein